MEVQILFLDVTVEGGKPLRWNGECVFAKNAFETFLYSLETCSSIEERLKIKKVTPLNFLFGICRGHIFLVIYVFAHFLFLYSCILNNQIRYLINYI